MHPPLGDITRSCSCWRPLSTGSCQERTTLTIRKHM
jgi:hypothetical protein